MQVQAQKFDGSSTICTNGKGDACSANYAEENNPTNVFNKTSQFYPTNNCGTQIPARGIGATENDIDQMSGLAVEYKDSMNSALSWSGLSSELHGHPSGVQGLRGHLHPFPGLKVIYETLGATLEVPLNNLNETFAVEPASFIETEYPVSTTPGQETKTITVSESVTTDGTKLRVWALVLYLVLLVGFIGLLVFLIMKHVKESGEENDKQAD